MKSQEVKQSLSEKKNVEEPGKKLKMKICILSFYWLDILNMNVVSMV